MKNALETYAFMFFFALGSLLIDAYLNDKSIDCPACGLLVSFLVYEVSQPACM